MLQWGRGLSAAETDTERSCGTTWGVLQWGRGLSATETCADALAAPGEVCFNEGPRPFGRGNLIAYHDLQTVGQASMGPRPFGRGNNVPPAIPGGGCRSSMGARGLSAAETCCRLSTRAGRTLFNGAAAFRPWKLAVGEHRKDPNHSSMGPRPFGRGNPQLIRLVMLHCDLQWGRGLSAAETP